MKEIAESRALLGATADLSLKELNGLYKGLMKQHHPDRFTDEAERSAAEAMSQRIIAAYKLLEGLHPETRAARAEEFERTLASGIAGWQYKGRVLSLTFGDGSEHVFVGVPANTYNKFVGTDATPRFVRRHLIGAFPQRRVSSAVAV
ncbi:MAG: KTSC domain-containing protein [Flavobacteriales bacterium]|jgi:DnaJ-class molecular chaperone|nr:KTSC domain-containing protein [Flavobacteriales bacterium]MBK7943732.1 KTSC domain-containing protein [Flavobacteriales bacterium]MBK8950459.1 KTSC domain-containing protein [Flavobacteriales bacterium]MBK9699587.1 KTSC domain-containing protein [Flavobacteriales bacterium]